MGRCHRVGICGHYSGITRYTQTAEVSGGAWSINRRAKHDGRTAIKRADEVGDLVLHTVREGCACSNDE